VSMPAEMVEAADGGAARVLGEVADAVMRVDGVEHQRRAIRGLEGARTGACRGR